MNKVFNNSRFHRWVLGYLAMAGLLLSQPADSSAQILFAEECFTGGITVSGAGNRGVNFGVEADIRWESDFSIRNVYAFTYRWGHIAPHSTFINGGEVYWDLSSQIGPEIPDGNPWSHPFAVHVRDVTETVIIEDSVVSFDFPPQQFYENAWNWGWWSVYLVVLYEAPHIEQEVCFRLYTADQRQDLLQSYYFDLPSFDPQYDFVLGTYGANIAGFSDSGSTVWFNGDTLGEVLGNDPTSPPTLGVQGHFFYENASAQGLNGDTANQTFGKHDAVAQINNKVSEGGQQLLQIKRSYFFNNPGSNPHPAFTLAYTPSCPVTSTDAVPRSYHKCRGDTLQLAAAEGFEHYAWTPAEGLSDTAATDPLCFADSSGWYRLRMWNDDAAQGCPATIPVWVEVGQTPRPHPLTVTPSGCNSPT